MLKAAVLIHIFVETVIHSYIYRERDIESLNNLFVILIIDFCNMFFACLYGHFWSIECIL